MTFTITPVAGRLGAEVRHISLSDPLDDATFSALYQALLQYKVLFLRNQHLNDEQHEAFSRRFGPQVPHPTVDSDRQTSAILNLDSRESRASSWHTDVTFVVDYPKVSILRGEVIPPFGGDTVWANTASAYQDLPQPLQHLADTLWARHTNVYDYVPSKNVDATLNQRRRESFVSAVYETEHPLVHVHPETGERNLLLGHFVRQIQGVSPQDSALLFQLFQQRITSLNNTVRWRWQQGDVVIWDNRATQHIAVDDYGDAARIVRRTTVAGDIPVSVDGRHSRAILPTPTTRSPQNEQEKQRRPATAGATL
ncbi:TauD/TfdA dioxygenase family protein [Shimwellia blattae]|uniref:Putative taurine dioxygenase n=1 Tax=Shimwellia blattae (strain ATCC 29907 / DSM 4481 / JCM 1650 / NBRC 105725 / CDC 9005-74) TaxID=630626 RepID=I2B655_SHIBC|nr:TauD/TfdA family dioxygenase [Shimwellia blattae]AFJ46009.1 putative taurine dioxygenase [Shimwellia blattae DSM 4481 = NBRC 105725]GAB82712.1 alpha-ketoglutarate-dependent taurine dioxygenase [Shimwellia blattae DSM 4481 = NBRC 105725]VDY63485.1 Alpha-ketoglutarate-dependent taurine dioxygenase [Shimwellia blattae]VEC21427.1 Alpha-ketoglutarate-dependent taurine dioxygenase [Shimwellia blattae]